jgi:hypothetical protein
LVLEAHSLVELLLLAEVGATLYLTQSRLTAEVVAATGTDQVSTALLADQAAVAVWELPQATPHQAVQQHKAHQAEQQVLEMLVEAA